MSKMRSLTPAVTTALAIAVVTILTVAIGTRTSLAKANDPATECLVQLQGADETELAATESCIDGDACDGDGATNGQCAFKARVAVNVGGVTGCTPQPLKKLTVKPKKAGINVSIPSGSSSATGAFTSTLILKLRKGGDKASKPKKVTATVKAVAKKVGDKDSSKITCTPCPSESCVPTTTTTTVTPTTTSTSTTTLPCGNGAIDAGETCDPDAAPNGCSGGTPYCNATCDGCQANCSTLAFELGTPTSYCGFPGADDNALPPLSGELRDGSDVKTDGGDLGLGCLYIGGGEAIVVPPGPTPDGSQTLLGVTDCSVNAIALEPADTGNSRNCTVGPTTSKHCVNGHPGLGNGVCNVDGDCQPVCVNGQCVDGAPGTDGNGACPGGNQQCGASSLGGTPTLVCQPDPSCFFGAPLPIANAGLSTCVLNVIADGVTGSGDVAAGTADITLPLKSWVYLTGPEPAYNPDAVPPGNPCPICDNGVCSAGKRAGQACTSTSDLKVTHDCPPGDHLFLAPLAVTLGPLTTQTVTTNAGSLGTCVTTGCDVGLTNCCSLDGSKTCQTDSACEGIFCPGPTVQRDGGAFGQLEARKIIQNGTPAAGGLDVTAKDATLASVFCIPETNNSLIDGSANLPGPGSTALGGTVRLR